MTKSKAQKEAEAAEKQRQEDMINDPGKSPTDVNKDSSASAPVDMTVTDVSSPPNDDKD